MEFDPVFADEHFNLAADYAYTPEPTEQLQWDAAVTGEHCSPSSAEHHHDHASEHEHCKDEPAEEFDAFLHNLLTKHDGHEMNIKDIIAVTNDLTSPCSVAFESAPAAPAVALHQSVYGAPQTSAAHDPAESSADVEAAPADDEQPLVTPSKFCHICSRRAADVKQLPCGNLRFGTCRKVICEKCFDEYGWSLEGAVAAGPEWLCTHCLHVCPTKAQCKIYNRTNAKTKVKRAIEKKQKKTKQTVQVNAPGYSM